MYGSIKGIAGNAVQSVPLLELSSDNDEGSEQDAFDITIWIEGVSHVK